METINQNQAQDSRPAHLERMFRPGKTLNELASELTRIADNKRDFRVPLSKLEAVVDNSTKDQVALTFPTASAAYPLNQWAGGQVADFTDIPKLYFKRLGEENPELLTRNINHGLTKVQRTNENSTRLVRTIDNRVRGFLSNRFLILDSHDILEAALPLLVDKEFQVTSCEVTETRMYLKTATPRIQGEVKTGDVVSYGVMISSSDVGAGSIRVEPYFLRLWCLNGAVMETKFRRAHLGRSTSEREVQEILTAETRSLSNQALLGTIRDYLSHTMKPEIFNTAMDRMRDAAKREIKNFDLEEVVEVTMSTVGVSGKNVRDGIVQALADGNQNAGLTQWGLMNSFTAAAKMPSIDYDTATDLERAGGQILNLTKTQWTRIAEKQH